MPRWKRSKKAKEEADGEVISCRSSKADENESIPPKSHLSVKDSAVIILLSTLLSIGLVTATLGITGITDKLTQHEWTDVLLTISAFICLFSLVTYLLVKYACHYLVYFAIGTLFAIVFPVSKRRQRAAVREIYDKAENR